MRKSLVFLLFSFLAPIACLRPAPALAPDQVLVTAKPKLMSADYRGDLNELARLREQVLPLADDPALGYLAHYWAGFASWRIAINGANQKMGAEDLIANLEKAAASFETAVRLKDDFADGYAAAASVNGWLGAFDMSRNKSTETPERIKKFWQLLERAKELEPDNPRVLWVQAVPFLILPPDKGGDLNRAIELYRRMDAVSPARSDAGSPLPDWGKPEAADVPGLRAPAAVRLGLRHRTGPSGSSPAAGVVLCEGHPDTADRGSTEQEGQRGWATAVARVTIAATGDGVSHSLTSPHDIFDGFRENPYTSGMTWTDIRQRYPRGWLLVEAVLAHSEAGKRYVDELAVVDTFPDGETALRAYLKLHREAPARELYVVHSDREELEITERAMLGLRAAG